MNQKKASLLRLEDIEEFEQVQCIPRPAINKDILKGIRSLHEIKAIELFLRDILPDNTNTPHTSTEIADILSSHITVAGQPKLAAFINKGKTTKSVTSKKVAHQISRVRRIPQLDVMILLAVGDIYDDAKMDFLQAAQDANADYVIIDAIDVARIFIAYHKVCPKDGNPYIDGHCYLCKRPLSEPIELILKVHEEPWYTILKQNDSSGLAKRYSVDVLTDSHYSKVILRGVLSRVVWEVRHSNFYRSDQIEQHFGNQEADCVFVFLFTDIRDVQTYNWRCQTIWVRPSLPIQARPFTRGNEWFGEIQIEWNSMYSVRQKLYSQQSVKKEVWIKRVEAILPRVDHVLQKVDEYIDQLNCNMINLEEFQNIFEQMEKEAGSIFEEAGQRGLPPIDCGDCDSAFIRMVANFHNIFVPFATWGKADWKWKQKIYLRQRARQNYETDKAVFLHEWKKIK